MTITTDGSAAMSESKTFVEEIEGGENVLHHLRLWKSVDDDDVMARCRCGWLEVGDRMADVACSWMQHIQLVERKNELVRGY